MNTFSKNHKHTCQVKASPRAFSESNSLFERGNEFLHNNTIRGNKPRTTELPKIFFISSYRFLFRMILIHFQIFILFT